ncbi:OmpA domain protein [Plesiocystis pacifica SIR-1]|uniref:OmpA domain protein n=1 Tax=Plesiocystis pacifica SIR-1 TaxID=391625 RepID=A6FYC8_9BACT|nr:OmpA family protein [Plesiocystis pacifica]EDM81507.1 OmpA domain protein [Plesiocystis pacifica SIR-1]
MRERFANLAVPSLALLLLLPSCAGQKLEGDVLGTQTRLQDAIADGSKTIGCAPKETALAEANVKFAEEALRMGEYYRGKEHVQLAAKYTEIAELKTDPVRCHAPGQVVAAAEPKAGDRDGDGYDDDVDSCPDEAEDFDAFEDEDGCPDRDNDKDGVLDAAEFENGVWTNNDQKDGVDCRNDPEDIDEFEDEDGCPDPDNDQDGILDVDDKCPIDPEDIDQFEDEDGCPELDNDKDGILDVDDQCPLDPEDIDGEEDEDGCPDLAVKVDPCAIKLDGKIMFDSGKYDLKSRKFADSNSKLLDDVYTVLNTNPDITIEIGGHTDSKGSSRSNQRLSENRVKSVREYLVDKGIDGSRITFKGYGEDVPVDTNRTKEGRENNRRVEILRTDNPECNNQK